MSLLLIDRFYVQVFPKEKKAEEFNVEDMKYIGWIYALISVLIVWHHSGMQQPSEEMQELVKLLQMNK